MLELWSSSAIGFAVHRIAYITPWALSVLPLSVAALLAARSRRLSPHVRHGLLWVALLGFFLPPVLPYLPNAGDWFLGLLPIPEWTDRTVSVAGDVSIATKILALHALGWFVLAGRLLVDTVQLHRMHRTATRIESGELYEQMRGIASSLGIRRLPRLFLSRDASTPFSSGTIRPAITLPREMFERLGPDVVGHILAHELIHHRNRDVWLNMLRLVICSFWFFHPMVWILGRRIRDVREECCDATLVSELSIRRREYSQSLLDAAELSVAPNMFGFSAGMLGVRAWKLAGRWRIRSLFADDPLETRLMQLASTRRPRRGLSRLQRAGLLFLALLVMPPAPGKSDSTTSSVPAHHAGHTEIDPHTQTF